jgi:hypothetical protein
LLRVVLAEPERYKTREQRSDIYRRFLEAVRGIPGVTSAGTVDAVLGRYSEHQKGLKVVNRGGQAEITERTRQRQTAGETIFAERSQFKTIRFGALKSVHSSFRFKLKT